MKNEQRLASERFIHWNRTPTTRFIRAVFASDGTVPHEYSLGDAYVYGHSLDSKGNCIRLFYCDLTIENDGLFEYRPDSKRKDAEAGSPLVRLTKPLPPMSAEYSADSTRASEAMIRADALDHWSIRRTKERERKRLEALELERVARERASQEAQADREAAEDADRKAALHRVIAEREAKKTKPRTWFDVLRGRP